MSPNSLFSSLYTQLCVALARSSFYPWSDPITSTSLSYCGLQKCTKCTTVENFLPRNAFSSISTVVEYCCIHSLMRVSRRKKIFFDRKENFVQHFFCADREKEGWCIIIQLTSPNMDNSHRALMKYLTHILN